jgi:hypothetical protein
LLLFDLHGPKVFVEWLTLVFGRSRVQISAGRPVILADTCSFPQLLLAIVSKLVGHNPQGGRETFSGMEGNKKNATFPSIFVEDFRTVNSTYRPIKGQVCLLHSNGILSE